MGQSTNNFIISKRGHSPRILSSRCFGLMLDLGNISGRDWDIVFNGVRCGYLEIPPVIFGPQRYYLAIYCGWRTRVIHASKESYADAVDMIMDFCDMIIVEADEALNWRS